MATRFATKSEIDTWNQRVIDNPDGGNVFQSAEFANLKKRGGWKTRHIIADEIALTVLEKFLPSLGKIWYIPKGPGIVSVEDLKKLLPDLKRFARKARVFLIKIEPELLSSPGNSDELSSLGLVKSAAIQPNVSTVLLDISQKPDEIMSSLHQKGRHAIKRAERDGVTVSREPATEQNCRIMYSLLSETAAGSFRIRSYNYYRAFWQSFEKANMGQLFFARFGDDIIAGAFAMIFGHKSTYKDGASSRDHPQYGASHLLQWNIVKWAHENGATVHDLCGTPPAAHIKDQNHPYYGLGRFKTSFNKTVTDYVGVYDFVIMPVPYRIWRRAAHRLAVRWHNFRQNENYF